MKRLIVTALCIVFAAVSFAAEEKRTTVPLADSPVLGPADAPVTIIEFLDFQ